MTIHTLTEEIGTIIAAIPPKLGYYPHNSIVVVPHLIREAHDVDGHPDMQCIVMGACEPTVISSECLYSNAEYTDKERNTEEINNAAQHIMQHCFDIGLSDPYSIYLVCIIVDDQLASHVSNSDHGAQEAQRITNVLSKVETSPLPIPPYAIAVMDSITTHETYYHIYEESPGDDDDHHDSMYATGTIPSITDTQQFKDYVDAHNDLPAVDMDSHMDQWRKGLLVLFPSDSDKSESDRVYSYFGHIISEYLNDIDDVLDRALDQAYDESQHDSGEPGQMSKENAAFVTVGTELIGCVSKVRKTVREIDPVDSPTVTAIDVDSHPLLAQAMISCAQMFSVESGSYYTILRNALPAMMLIHNTDPDINHDYYISNERHNYILRRILYHVATCDWTQCISDDAPRFTTTVAADIRTYALLTLMFHNITYGKPEEVNTIYQVISGDMHDYILQGQADVINYPHILEMIDEAYNYRTENITSLSVIREALNHALDDVMYILDRGESADLD